MDTKIVKHKMKKLSKKLRYKFHNLGLLSQAMRAEKERLEGEGKNADNRTNDALATVGDALLSLLVCEYFYSDGIKTKSKITEQNQH